MPELLRVEHLYAGYDGTDIIKDISFSLDENEILGIVGESGSGKSTVAKLLTGLHTPTSGNIFLDGKDITHTRGKERRALYTRIQMVFQDASGSFNPRRTIGAMIGETICRLCTPDERDTKRRVAELLADVGLPAAYADRYPHEMTYPYRQRSSPCSCIYSESTA